MNRSLLVLPTLLCTVSCGTDPTEDPGPGELVQSSLQRDRQPVVPSTDLAQAVAENTAFGFSLYEAVRTPPGNLFFSPFGVSLSLVMPWAGARGETESQMAATLGFGLPQARQHAAFNALDLALAARGEGTGGEFELEVLNSTWGQIGYTFLPAYLDTLAVNYGAGLRLINFQGAPDASRVAINAWVEHMTEGRIPALLPQGSVGPETRLALANALYFKAAWKWSFDPAETADGLFQKLDGTAVTVPVMHGLVEGRYADLDALQAIELPYAGEQLALVVLLPPAGGLPALEADLPARAAEALAALAGATMELRMPRFGCAQTMSLADVLSGMGMPLAFAEDADFTGMDGGLRPLRLGALVHQAFVQVNEDGTEAAAGQGAILDAGGGTWGAEYSVSIDRPFVFFVRDVPTGSVVFLGRVVAP